MSQPHRLHRKCPRHASKLLCLLRRRILRLTATQPAPGLWFRAWVGSADALLRSRIVLIDGPAEPGAPARGGAR